MKVILSSDFEKELKEFKSKHSSRYNLIDKRFVFVAGILKDRGYNAALRTRYFSKCKGSEFIHEIRAKNKGLNFRFLCALFDEGKTCVFFHIFCESKSSDYKLAIKKAERRANDWYLKREELIWRGK